MEVVECWCCKTSISVKCRGLEESIERVLDGNALSETVKEQYH